MDRRRFLLTSLAGALAAPLAAGAQQARKVWQIGYLAAGNRSENLTYLNSFRQGLRDLGYLEGRNIAIEYRWGEGNYERLPLLAAELVKVPVDVIVTAQSTPATFAAKKATLTIPIVMVGTGDPVKTGLVSNLARPEGNVTGSSAFSVEVIPKRLELIKQLLPKATRIALLWNPENPSNTQLRELLLRAAPAVSVTLLSIEVRHPTEFDGAFTRITRLKPDALIVTGDPLHQFHIERIVDFATRSRLPTTSNIKANVEAGALMSYGPDYPELYRRAASYVGKILNGTKLGDLPVEQPTNFELVINLKTAKALGLTIPPSLLARADQVIE